MSAFRGIGSAALAAAVLFGCTGTQPPQAALSCHMLHVTDVPFVAVAGLMFVPATINGKHAIFMFDTGVYATTVTTAAAARFKLADRGVTIQSSGIGGAARDRLAMAESFQLGQLVGTGFPLFVNDPRSLNNDVKIDGWLSTNFLSHYDIDIDFPDHIIRFFAPLGDCSHASVYLDGDVYRVPMLGTDSWFLNRHVRIPVTIRGQTFQVLFDTGAPHTILFRKAAERLGLTRQALGADASVIHFGFGPGKVPGSIHVFEPISIGEVTIEHLPVHVVNSVDAPLHTDIVLGGDFVSRVHIWISYSSRSFIMQYPVRPSPPLPKPGVSRAAPPSVPSAGANPIPAPRFLSIGRH